MVSKGQVLFLLVNVASVYGSLKRNVLYAGVSGAVSNSAKNKISCAASFVDHSFVAIRIEDSTGVCEGLTWDWGKSPMYDSGYSYYEKKTAEERYGTPSVPFVRNFGRLTPNTSFQIVGIPLLDPTRITVCIQQGAELDANEIAMAFDIRFPKFIGQHAVVQNHKQGSWGIEQTESSFFPFYPGVPFDIIIMFEPTCFKVNPARKGRSDCDELQPFFGVQPSVLSYGPY